MAGILLDGLTGDTTFYTTPEDTASTSKGDTSTADDRAELILQLLLNGLDGNAPNVGHMLLGFNVEHGSEGTELFPSCSPSIIHCFRADSL